MFVGIAYILLAAAAVTRGESGSHLLAFAHKLGTVRDVYECAGSLLVVQLQSAKAHNLVFGHSTTTYVIYS